jgi:hypothetical protein
MFYSVFITLMSVAMFAAQQTSRLDSVPDSFGQLPLSFELNRRQTDRRVRFLARSGQSTLFFTDSGTVLAMSASGEHAVVIRTTFAAAKPEVRIQAEEELTGKVNYLVGRPDRWRTQIPLFGRLRYSSIYPGIDAVFYGRHDLLEYDLNVSPGATPDRIRLRFDGADTLGIDHSGNLVLHTKYGDIVQHAPHAYQLANGSHRPVTCRYTILAENEVEFSVGTYDHRRPLVIDPALSYSSFLGGSGEDDGSAIAVDSKGHAYVAGYTYSADFPTTPGAVDRTLQSPRNAFVTKFNPAGKADVFHVRRGQS